MTKYNVGDVLEITEDFELEGASYSKGEKYTVTEEDGKWYELLLANNSLDFLNSVSEVDAHSGFRKVEPKVEFKVGDKVRLLEGAHGNPELGFFWGTEESFETHYGYHYDLAEPFVIRVEIDLEGEVGITQGGWNSYVLSEFLVPWVEEEEKPAEHMELGKTYHSSGNGFFYTPTAIDFESERVEFDFVSEPGSFVSKSDRPFYEIELEFGVLPPVKPENEYTTVTAEEFRKGVQEAKAEALGESKVNYVEIDPKLEVPATVSVVALREAFTYVDQEYLDIDKLIELAKRLS